MNAQTIDLSQPTVFLDIFYDDVTQGKQPSLISKNRDRKWKKFGIVFICALLMILCWYRIANTPDPIFNQQPNSGSKTSPTIIVKDIHTEWVSKLNQLQFIDIYEFLDQVKKNSIDHPEILITVKALRWATTVEEYIHEQNSKTSVKDLSDDSRIELIISQWEADKHQIYRELYVAAVKSYGNEYSNFLYRISDHLQMIYAHKKQLKDRIGNMRDTIKITDQIKRKSYVNKSSASSKGVTISQMKTVSKAKKD